MKKRILIVDDDKLDRKTLKRIFSEMELDHMVVEKASGKKALEYIYNTRIKPSTIFLDLNMPKMNGWKFLEKLKADSNNSKIPVIVFSNSDSLSDLARAKISRVKGFFNKPTNYSDMLDLFRNNLHMLEKLIDNEGVGDHITV